MGALLTPRHPFDRPQRGSDRLLNLFRILFRLACREGFDAIGRQLYLLMVAAPAVHITSSCEPVAPEQPMAPISLPSSTSGMPPREAMTSSIVNKNFASAC